MPTECIVCLRAIVEPGVIFLILLANGMALGYDRVQWIFWPELYSINFAKPVESIY